VQKLHNRFLNIKYNYFKVSRVSLVREIEIKFLSSKLLTQTLNQKEPDRSDMWTNNSDWLCKLNLFPCKDPIQRS